MGVCIFALSSCAVPETGVVDEPAAVPTTEPSVSPQPGVQLDAYVTIAEVDADQVRASGGVSGVLESGGACRFEFESESGEVLIVESAGASDVSGTSCGLVEVDITRFSAGHWTVLLDYFSASGSARSNPIDLEVP